MQINMNMSIWKTKEVLLTPLGGENSLVKEYIKSKESESHPIYSHWAPAKGETALGNLISGSC